MSDKSDQAVPDIVVAAPAKPEPRIDQPTFAEMTTEQRTSLNDAKAWEVQQAGIQPCSFAPIADLFIEIYPGDHPFIEESFTKRENNSPLGKPISVDNPYKDKGAVMATGRYCIRFAMDEEGLAAHIKHLQEVLDVITTMNKKGVKASNVPALMPMDNPAFLPQYRRHTATEDQEEIKGSTEKITRKYHSMEEARQAQYKALQDGLNNDV